jgi:hypothetical protein
MRYDFAEMVSNVVGKREGWELYFVTDGIMVRILLGEEALAVYQILLTYLLTPWSTVLLEKLTCLQLVKKFPAIYGTRRFITALTSARNCLYPESAQSIP